ncbi:hypothetical protein F4779DRAFT_516936 [Xylariaceae sp. FL0662B]|nr:hypothetical protein F4779DRAFT_516936 [Xylariaceae sp. FL0662B]
MTQDDHEPRGAARGPPPAAQVYAKFEETSLEPEEHQDHPDRDTVTIPVHAHHHPNADGDGDGEAQQNDDAPPRPSIMEGFESITPDEFLRVYKVPCAREGFMTGIGVGAVVGTGRYIIGGRLPTYLLPYLDIHAPIHTYTPIHTHMHTYIPRTILFRVRNTTDSSTRMIIDRQG